MRLYNTLTRSEETFTPGRGNTVRMYTCGLTVYARGHIGNFRTFVCLDVLRRTLKYLLGYNVKQVMNFTDVDDRTIAGAQKAGMDLRSYTDQYIEAFREDARALGLEAVEETPRATDEPNLRAMADLIIALERNGHTTPDIVLPDKLDPLQEDRRSLYQLPGLPYRQARRRVDPKLSLEQAYAFLSRSQLKDIDLILALAGMPLEFELVIRGNDGQQRLVG